MVIIKEELLGPNPTDFNNLKIDLHETLTELNWNQNQR